MNKDSNPIDLEKLKDLIHEGMQQIQSGVKNHEAVLFIGDTGVGKSTIMSFLSGQSLIVRFDGIKPYLDTTRQTKIKIGHQKFSQTSIPTKTQISGMTFYDCPGFKDNKGQQYEISNAFFIQRLFDVYGKIKIIIVVDESHISQARADKLPKLIKNMHKSFGRFENIQDGCCIVVNKADPQNCQDDYEQQLLSVAYLENQDGHLLDDQERSFLKYIVNHKRLLLFYKVNKKNQNKLFVPTDSERRIAECIKSINFTKSPHIQKIISQPAKIAIHDFIDEVEANSGQKIEIICTHIMDNYSQKMQQIGRKINQILLLKQNIIKLIEEIKMAKPFKIMEILQQQLSHEDIQDFQEDFASVMFFQNIYDKSQVYLSNLITKIESELSYLIVKIDQRITYIQQHEKQQQQRERQMLEQKMKEQRRQEMRIKISRLCLGFDSIVKDTKNICQQKQSELARLQSRLSLFEQFEAEVKQARRDFQELSKMRLNLANQFKDHLSKIQQKVV